MPLNTLQEALKLPKQTPEEKAMRDRALQAGLQKAVTVPYNLAMDVNRLWPTLVKLATVGNLTTVSDLQVGYTACSLADVSVASSPAAVLVTERSGSERFVKFIGERFVKFIGS